MVAKETHIPPWECPEHGQAMLFANKGGLYCGICHEISILRALNAELVEALEGLLEESKEALLFMTSGHGADSLEEVPIIRKVNALLGKAKEQ